MNTTRSINKLKTILLGLLLTICASSHASENANIHSLGQQLAVGDVVFIQVTPYPFQKVASTTHSWVNHVGIVIDTSGTEPVIAESTFPFSKKTSFNKFIARSDRGRVAVLRLNQRLTNDEKLSIRAESNKRMGVFYDTGFDLHSNGEFCSRFVREVITDSTGINVGEVETFRTLLDKTPKADLTFWHIWYFGNIPWSRETVTPASLYRSAQLKTVFDGNAI
ncbi:MAG: YebB family permuted papain-like enzyme [Methylophilaceae bacterium]